MNLVGSLTCILICIALASTALSQRVYFYKDEKGITTATTTPPLDNVQHEADSFGKKSTPAEIEQFNREQRAAETRRESIRRFNRNQEEARQQRESERRTVQDARDQRADQLKAVVGAVTSDMPSSQRRGFEEAAQRKAEQIKAGTDKPISPSEDMRFHVEQEVRWQIEKDRILRPKK